MKKLILITGMIIMITFVASSVNAQSTQSPDKATKNQTAQTDKNVKGTMANTDGKVVCDHKQHCKGNEKCSKFLDGNGDGVCDNCTGNENCCKENCCKKSMKKGECAGMKTANCCSKGHKHGHGSKKCQPAECSKPGK